MLYKSLIVLDLDCEKSVEVISKMGEMLYDNGYVYKDYIKSVLDREVEYPTGLPTEPAIAIPHTSSNLVKKAGIAVALLKKPVEFYQMGGSNDKLDVEIVFMLAIDNSEKHLKYLQEIMNIFEDYDLLKKLKNSKSVDEVYDILSFINS